MPAMAGDVSAEALPEGIFSLLDTDLYKLTMQCAILKYLPDVSVTYAFTNRTPDMRLSRKAYQWVESQVYKFSNIKVTDDEIQFLRNTCPYFSEAYLEFLVNLRLRPSEQVRFNFVPVQDTGSPADVGDLHLEVQGLWLETILYEVPLLALISEAYFKFCDTDWTHDGQKEWAYEKGMKLLNHGCLFSEFGTRRRRDYRTHDLVMQGLLKAAKKGSEETCKGKLGGTSNVHFAMKYGLPPVGTVAHEWFMGIASITNDYENANETALRYWVGCFGEGVLGIALTDTFGTPVFLKAFGKSLPSAQEAEQDSFSTQLPGAPSPAITPGNSVVNITNTNHTSSDSNQNKSKDSQTYAAIFSGVRQDSGNPIELVDLMRDFYKSQGISERKTIVFSDSLNIELCQEYKRVAEDRGFQPSFGIGTFLTNDFVHTSNGKKSTPLNIVIKLSSAAGRPAIKISDNAGKNSGDPATVRKVKETLGYVEKQWADGDEKTRWGSADGEVPIVKVQA